MPKITAYKCPFTKKIFETRSGYRRHLLKLRVKKAETRARRKLHRIAAKIRADKLAVIETALRNVRTIPELEQAFIDHFGGMMEHNSQGIKGFKMVEFDLSSMRYSNSVSNTHACPRNGVTNWGGRKEGAPRGYKGFSGRIEYTVTEPETFDRPFWDISNTVKRFGVHTGTGGGRGKNADGDNRYYYDVKIFLDDFPGLANHVENIHEEHKRIIFTKKLAGQPVGSPIYDEITG